MQECHRLGAELKCTRAGGVVGIPIDQVESIEREAPQPLAPARRAPLPPGALAPQPLPPILDTAAPAAGALTPESAQARIDQLNASGGGSGGAPAAAHHELSILYCFLGNEAMQGHRYEEAIDLYHNALVHDSRLLVARLNLCTAMLDLNRGDAAEPLLKALLTEHPDNERAMQLMGEAAMQAGHVDEAIEWWEKCLAVSPSTALQTRLDRARRLRSAEEGFQRSDAAHFSMKFDGDQASPDLAREILSYLEDSLSELSSRFAQYPEGVIQVTLYSKQAFQGATESPDWVGGLFDGQIRMPIGGLSHLTPQVRRVLMHELTHCVVTSKSHGNAPQWIQEGIAQVCEGKSDAATRSALRQGYAAPGGTVNAGEFSYPRALSQVEFFLHTWSDSHFNDLLDHLGRGADIDAALRAVTGLSYDEFLKAWTDSLDV